MMTSEDFHEALESHLFLKQKCDDSIKGRMVADGSKQHTSIMEEDATSPTVALEKWSGYDTEVFTFVIKFESIILHQNVEF
jgi:hypothetical protein